tara:strand:- start:156 stop:1247 length:1092 start_codon:yes stop_codon:yes gene_type:complete
MSTKYYRPLNRTIAGLVASWTDLALPSATPDGIDSLDDTWECAVKVDRAEDSGDVDSYIYTPSCVGTLSTELDAWTLQGAQDIVQMLEFTNPRDLHLFSVPRKLTETGFKLDTNTVLSVESRHTTTQLDIPAIKGHSKHKFQYRDPGSIYYATNSCPVWYTDKGKIFITPFISSTYSYYVNTVDYPQHGIYWYNPLDTSYTYDEANYELPGISATHKSRPLSVIDHWICMQGDGIETLSNGVVTVEDVDVDKRVPEKYNMAIALYVGIELMSYRKRSMWDKLPNTTDYSADYTTPTEASSGWEKVRWYIEIDEDSELTQMKIAELNGEQQKFILDYQWYEKTEAELKRKYQQFFTNETQKKEA